MDRNFYLQTKNKIIVSVSDADYDKAKQLFTAAAEEMNSDEYQFLANEVLELFLSRHDYSLVHDVRRVIGESLSSNAVYEGLSRYYRKNQSPRILRDMIISCIAEYQDIETAKYWLVKAQREMSDMKFNSLSGSVLEYLFSKNEPAIVEKIRGIIPNNVYNEVISRCKETVISNLAQLVHDHNFDEAKELCNKYSDILTKTDYLDLLNYTKKIIQEQEDLDKEQKPFLEISKKYRVDINKLVNKKGPTQLSQLLKKIDNGTDLTKSEAKLLEEEGEDRLLANYYYLRYKRQHNVWDLSQTCSSLRKAGMPDQAIRITNNFSEKSNADSNAISAVFTSRGGSFRDVGQRQSARQCAKIACKVSPHSYQPYNLLGGICFDEGYIESGEDYFAKAIALGSPTYFRDFERKQLIKKEYILKARAFGGPGTSTNLPDEGSE